MTKMDSSLMRGSSLAATYPSARVGTAPARRAASDGGRRAAAAFREHAPVYVRHPGSDGASVLWRKGRLLVCDRATGRCRCLVESVVDGKRGVMTEEVTVSGDAVLARDMNQPNAEVDNLTTGDAGLGVDNDAAIVNLLRARYEHLGDKRIYTACGADMILSINPWEALDPVSLARAERGLARVGEFRQLLGLGAVGVQVAAERLEEQRRRLGMRGGGRRRHVDREGEQVVQHESGHVADVLERALVRHE